MTEVDDRTLKVARNMLASRNEERMRLRREIRRLRYELGIKEVRYRYLLDLKSDRA